MEFKSKFALIVELFTLAHRYEVANERCRAAIKNSIIDYFLWYDEARRLHQEIMVTKADLMRRFTSAKATDEIFGHYNSWAFGRIEV